MTSSHPIGSPARQTQPRFDKRSKAPAKPRSVVHFVSSPVLLISPSTSHRTDVICSVVVFTLLSSRLVCYVFAPFFASRQFRRWKSARKNHRTRWTTTPRRQRQIGVVLLRRPTVRTSTSQVLAVASAISAPQPHHPTRLLTSLLQSLSSCL